MNPEITDLYTGREEPDLLEALQETEEAIRVIQGERANLNQAEGAHQQHRVAILQALGVAAIYCY